MWAERIHKERRRRDVFKLRWLKMKMILDGFRWFWRIFPITESKQSKQSAGKMCVKLLLVPGKKHIQVGLDSRIFRVHELSKLWTWAVERKEAGKHKLKRKKTMIETWFQFLCFSWVSWAVSTPASPPCAARLGLEEAGGPTTADLMARTRSWWWHREEMPCIAVVGWFPLVSLLNWLKCVVFQTYFR